jgi:hypothetical protein
MNRKIHHPSSKMRSFFILSLCMLLVSCTTQSVTGGTAEPQEPDSATLAAQETNAQTTGIAELYTREQISLEYDHNFEWAVGSIGLQISVTGWIPVDEDQSAFVNYWCPNNKTKDDDPDYYLNRSSHLSGSGQLAVEGAGVYADGCSCSFTDTVDVEIEALTWWKPNSEGCSDHRINFQLDETWYTNPDWTCVCEDKDAEPFVEMNMEQLPARPSEGMSEGTLEFEYGFNNQYFAQELSDPTGMGSGMYKWTYHTTATGHENYPTEDPNRLDPEQPGFKKTPGFGFTVGGPWYTNVEGEWSPTWGPPLDQIPIDLIGDWQDL